MYPVKSGLIKGEGGSWRIESTGNVVKILLKDGGKREGSPVDSGTCSGGSSPPPTDEVSSDSFNGSEGDELMINHNVYNGRFHLDERRRILQAELQGNNDTEDTFAGRKYLDGDPHQLKTIKSAKGTVRGVRNRVRAGIATFAQINSTKTWQEKEAGKIIVYTTTMGTVRETAQRCLTVRNILRTNMVKFYEKDAFMSKEVQAELKERMGSQEVQYPQVFIEGQHIGNAETIEKLNERGELRKILQPYKSLEACTTCEVCGGYRFLPCGVCNGSKKSVHRNHFTTELVALKCMNCDEVGLVKCYAC